MDIKKQIKKQKKKQKRFINIMLIIFIILPSALFLSQKGNFFFYIYLIVIEVLILCAIFIRIDKDYLRFSCNKNRLAIKYGIFKKRVVVSCDKVTMVDISERNSEFDIVIVTDSRIRKTDFKTIDGYFIKNYEGSYSYLKDISKNKDVIFFYFIAKNGLFLKYELLDTIYRTCVHAHFTDSAISYIKEYRK